jgi:hypothetical protein
MTHPVSPYLVPGFYDRALAQGRHRDIVGGRWDETGRIQMQILHDARMRPDHRLLDIGAGSLRLGCKAVPYLDPGHYWATDASRELMLRGRDLELADPSRLDPNQLIEDADFSLPGVPDSIDFAIAFGVFTHLPLAVLDDALASLRSRLPVLDRLLFTVFAAPEPGAEGPMRQPDGVVTHPHRPPYHFNTAQVIAAGLRHGWTITPDRCQLPRGQILLHARPIPCPMPNQD